MMPAPVTIITSSPARFSHGPCEHARGGETPFRLVRGYHGSNVGFLLRNRISRVECVFVRFGGTERRVRQSAARLRRPLAQIAGFAPEDWRNQDRRNVHG